MYSDQNINPRWWTPVQFQMVDGLVHWTIYNPIHPDIVTVGSLQPTLIDHLSTMFDVMANVA